jgi:hypothetical protein
MRLIKVFIPICRYLKGKSLYDEDNFMIKKPYMPAVISFSIIAAFCICCVCCKFTTDDAETPSYEAPQVSSSSTGVAISIVSIENTRYINVYRRKELVSGTYATPVNIGEIKPASGKAFPASVIFNDLYALSGTKYQYRVRYYDSSYKVSSWSTTVTGEVTVAAPSAVVYTVGSAVLTYDSDYKTLTISDAAIGAPSGIPSVSPQIALAAGSTASLFPLSSIAKDAVIHLTDILPSSYYGTAVSVLGIVGEVETDSEDKTYTCYYWTEPSAIALKEGGSTIASFTIASSSSTTDNDYSSPSSNILNKSLSAPAAVPHDYSCGL